MFEARLSNGAILKKLIEAIKDLVADVNFDISNDGINLQAMDSSHVALVVLQLRASEFDEFRCDRPQTLGISVGNLAKIMKLAGNDDAVTLRADDEASCLTLIFEGKGEEKVSEFKLTLLTLDTEHLGISEQDYNSQAVLSAGEFSRICRELAQLTDTLTVETDKDSMRFSVSGDIGAGTVTIRHNDTDKMEDRCLLNVTENTNMSYALRYLNMFNKASSLSDSVKLQMSPDIPIVVQYEFDLGEIKYFLAPKISDEA